MQVAGGPICGAGGCKLIASLENTYSVFWSPQRVVQAARRIPRDTLTFWGCSRWVLGLSVAEDDCEGPLGYLQ